MTRSLGAELTGSSLIMMISSPGSRFPSDGPPTSSLTPLTPLTPTWCDRADHHRLLAARHEAEAQDRVPSHLHQAGGGGDRVQKSNRDTRSVSPPLKPPASLWEQRHMSRDVSLVIIDFPIMRRGDGKGERQESKK
ncbi:hypothetical protein EYF80_042080 [Liparis tanakae]|uniref:Uncharacterized protein n=1 Tax=Liparis tanakae TaxID=230148 RepID=A0A4Z2G490_9TELE|nr:hypothetical protein EYF80_042080 [Liparis tanakae]